MFVPRILFCHHKINLVIIISVKILHSESTESQALSLISLLPELCVVTIVDILSYMYRCEYLFFANTTKYRNITIYFHTMHLFILYSSFFYI